MGILVEQQAVIKCLSNTAKYYEREDADEWTKGIHYGLLHGVDNILDNVPTITEQNIVKPYLMLLKQRMKERDDDNGGEPLNAIDKGYHLAFEHLCKEIENLLSEQGEQK